MTEDWTRHHGQPRAAHGPHARRPLSARAVRRARGEGRRRGGPRGAAGGTEGRAAGALGAGREGRATGFLSPAISRTSGRPRRRGAVAGSTPARRRAARASTGMLCFVDRKKKHHPAAPAEKHRGRGGRGGDPGPRRGGAGRPCSPSPTRSGKKKFMGLRGADGRGSRPTPRSADPHSFEWCMARPSRIFKGAGLHPLRSPSLPTTGTPEGAEDADLPPGARIRRRHPGRASICGSARRTASLRPPSDETHRQEAGRGALSACATWRRTVERLKTGLAMTKLTAGWRVSRLGIEP